MVGKLPAAIVECRKALRNQRYGAISRAAGREFVFPARWGGRELVGKSFDRRRTGHCCNRICILIGKSVRSCDMGQDHPYSSWRLATEVLGGCLHVAEIAYSSGAQGSGRGRMSETAGHGQSPLHGRLRTAVNLTNVSALLWRLDTLGCDIGDRWRELAALWQGHADGKCLVFGDIHAAMAELRSGQEALVERRLAAMHETAASGLEAAGLYRTVGIPIVEGLAAFHRGAYAGAVELLLPLRFDLWPIGGSHAPPDVVARAPTPGPVRARPPPI